MTDDSGCEYCDRSFRTDEALVEHLESHDREELSRVDRRRVEQHTNDRTARLAGRNLLVLLAAVTVGIGVVGALAVGGIMSAQNGQYAGGDGSASNPYEIANWNHLNDTRENPGANFTLVNDLDETTTGYSDVANATANSNKGFLPIGNVTVPFTGTFNGSGHEIRDLVIDRGSANDIGLFGFTGSYGRA